MKNLLKIKTMATVKIKFRASSSAMREGTLFYQVIHNRVMRQIRSGYKLHAHEWDAEKNSVVCSSGAGEGRRSYLIALEGNLHEDARRLRAIISQLDRSGMAYGADNVVEAFLLPTSNAFFVSYARGLVGRLEQMGKQRTAENYATTLNSFGRFRKARDVAWDEVDADLMAAYESFLVAERVCPNTISFYMRNLRAIYNRAVEKALTVQRHPFRHVYTGIGKTVKRAVPIEVVRRIRDLDLSGCCSLDYARDLFMFSFYTRGMSFIDMAYLKKKDLQNGILTYRRRKTSQQLSVKWEAPMQQIIDKYDTADTPYLLPILKTNGKDERHQYENAAHRVNRNLKKIGRILGLAIPLTTYVARHGWASIARSRNIPIATISEALGHDSETTTRIYLASLDTAVVDKANSLILKML